MRRNHFETGVYGFETRNGACGMFESSLIKNRFSMYQILNFGMNVNFAQAWSHKVQLAFDCVNEIICG